MSSCKGYVYPLLDIDVLLLQNEHALSMFEDVAYRACLFDKDVSRAGADCVPYLIGSDFHSGR